jgi:hypothetical protein
MRIVRSHFISEHRASLTLQSCLATALPQALTAATCNTQTPYALLETRGLRHASITSIYLFFLVFLSLGAWSGAICQNISVINWMVK